MRTLLATLAILFVLGTTARARDIYVNNLTGDDNNDGIYPQVGGVQGGPCRSITRALRLAEKADRIVLAKNAEPYHESITLQGGKHSGVTTQPFTIEGNGAILDGQMPVPHNVWEHFRGNVFRFRPSRMSHHLLYLEGRPAFRRDILGVPQSVPDLKLLEWCLFERHIYFRVEQGKLPGDYPLTHTVLPVGITLYEVRHVAIRDLVVQGFQLDGINAHDSAFDTSLLGVTCRGNGRSGVSVGGASRVHLDSCVVGDNGVAQLRTEGRSITRVINSSLLDNTGPAVQRDGGQVLLDGEEKTAKLPISPQRQAF